MFCKRRINYSFLFLFFFNILTQVCDSDTMLDPASSVEMVKVLEEDPMVGGVGGDVQVSWMFVWLFCNGLPYLVQNLTHLCVNFPADPEQV